MAGFVGEPGGAGEVAYGVEAWFAGAAEGVDDDVGAFDAGFGVFQAEVFGVADDAGGGDDAVNGELLGPGG